MRGNILFDCTAGALQILNFSQHYHLRNVASLVGYPVSTNHVRRLRARDAAVSARCKMAMVDVIV